jgi:hypothetical protein
MKKLRTGRRVLAERGIAGVVEIGERAVARAVRSARYFVTTAAPVITARLSHPQPPMLLAHHGGIGDSILLTAVARELRRRDVHPIWVMSQFPTLFERNGDVERIVPWTSAYEGWISRVGWRVVHPEYCVYDPDNDRTSEPAGHIISVMCQEIGITGTVSRRPYLTLSDDERERGQRVPRQVAIQSSGLSARFAMRTKEWFAERYQEVVTRLRGEVDFVHVGAASDPPLEGALDLRGRTSVRETAAILSRSLCFVGQVGFLMHLARAVDCRGVIVYGGREQPRQSGYSCNENLYSAVACSPCWLLNGCPYDMTCMRRIGADEVVDAVERQIARLGLPLEVDTDLLPLAPAVPVPFEREIGRTVVPGDRGARRPLPLAGDRPAEPGDDFPGPFAADRGD